MQPYTVQGFSNRENSETVYDLWSDKNVVVNGEERTEIRFASLEIAPENIVLLLELPEDNQSFQIEKLDEELLIEIESALANGFRIYKEKAWI